MLVQIWAPACDLLLGLMRVTWNFLTDPPQPRGHLRERATLPMYIEAFLGIRLELDFSCR